MQYTHISSKENNLVKHIAKLCKDKTYRLNSQEAVIYGEHLIIEALKYDLLKSIIVVDNIDIKKTDNSHMNNESDYLLLENIQNPNNLGAILRIAKASGINNIGLSSNCVDIYNLKVLLASQGIQFGLNIYANVDLPNFIDRYLGQVIATSLSATNNI